MGLDLTLLPFDGDFDGSGFSHTVLRVERWTPLFEEMQDRIEPSPVPEGFNSYLGRDDDDGEHRYGTTTKDAYYDPLGWVRARDLLQFREHIGVQQYEKNRAVWAYLAELPPETKVALYWE